jgi:hypothetical protein
MKAIWEVCHESWFGTYLADGGSPVPSMPPWCQQSSVPCTRPADVEISSPSAAAWGNSEHSFSSWKPWWEGNEERCKIEKASACFRSWPTDRCRHGCSLVVSLNLPPILRSCKRHPNALTREKYPVRGAKLNFVGPVLCSRIGKHGDLRGS